MDRVLESLGWMGSYQLKQFIVLMLPVLDCAMHVMSFIFIGKSIDYTCAKGSLQESSSPWVNMSSELLSSINGTTFISNTSLKVTFGKCEVKVTNASEELFSTNCQAGYDYAEPRSSSFVSELDLVCENEALGEVTQTVMAIGMMVGASFFAFVADKFGRKRVYIIAHVLLLATAVATAFVPDYTTFLVVRFLLGAMQQGVGLVSCILALELLPTARRAVSSQIGSFVWPGCLLMLALVCYLCRHMTWRFTQLVLAAWSAYALLLPWLIDESLRWLTATGRYEQAEKILVKAAKKNKVDSATILRIYRKETPERGEPESVFNQLHHGNTELDPCSEMSSSELHNGEDQVTNTKQKGISSISFSTEHIFGAPREDITSVTEVDSEPTFSAFFKNKKVFLLTALSCYVWFTDSLAYYGLLLMSSSLADDLYLGFTLGVLAEFPAAVAMLVLINRIGRRKCTFGSHLIGGVALLVAAMLKYHPAAAAIPGRDSLTLVVSLIGKFGISLGFSVLWLYTPELFPTTIRSTAFGISSVAARVGGMIAPYSRTLERQIPWLPGVIFASLCLVIPVLVIWLPETQGTELPQTLADLDSPRKQMESVVSNADKDGKKETPVKTKIFTEQGLQDSL